MTTEESMTELINRFGFIIVRSFEVRKVGERLRVRARGGRKLPYAFYCVGPSTLEEYNEQEKIKIEMGYSHDIPTEIRPYYYRARLD